MCDLIHSFNFSLYFSDCNLDELIGNNICNDENNNAACYYDGGDCGCTIPNHLSPWIVGDSYCHDEINIPGCNYDGGDCCGSDVNADYCSDCACYENCNAPFELIGDGFCNDETNTLNCNFDGGDCCNVCSNTTYCSECVCYLSNIADIEKGECHSFN